ncbi:MAG TPA: PAS domain-containing protein, partial [Acidobacteriota bacterium]|nr:PAS domain-containing protein [Acidobacteriota bacterium]
MIDRGRKDLFIDLLDNTYEAACIIDKDLNILFWNKSLEELTGNEAEEVINQKCKKNLLIQEPEEKLETCGEMCPVIQSFKDKVIRNYKAYILHKEGFRIPAFMRVFPIKNKNDS